MKPNTAKPQHTSDFEIVRSEGRRRCEQPTLVLSKNWQIGPGSTACSFAEGLTWSILVDWLRKG